ncbi:hypothetical protein [Streptomyces sp. NBC_01264]|uniref:hypothetical protein n=1 Tax=Streptomyces sp. NBC_01264 TaxID=2903804 RepID=UPI00224CC47E|nr:hypothetical protein [Streptomyces sp. NBC_01264]MCX4778071.1 hypothetical protein [Streptomyces sp. NBC_01264]
MPTTPVRFRRTLTAVLLSCALLGGATACGSGGGDKTAVGQADEVSVAMAAFAEADAAASAEDAEAAAAAPSASPAEKQKFAKARFVANAGLATGATYQWIIKPHRAGKFKKGAKGRTFAMVKAGLAGAFAYNRLKAAHENAKDDPLLSKAVGPLAASIESLKGLGSKLRKGQAGDADIGAFENVVNGVKEAGESAGATVTDKVPSAGQLTG